MSRAAIPILTFHALEEANTPISFPPALLERALKMWHAAGWRTLSLHDAVRHLRERAAFPEKTFVITFDDGYASVYRIAFPVLQKYEMTATIFVAPNEKNTGGSTPLPALYGREMLRWNEIREMRLYGIVVGAHSLTHRELTTLDEEMVVYELCASRDILADALGETIDLFAYPRGRFNTHIRELTMQFYQAACSDRLGIANFDSDLFALERVETFYLRAHWAMQGFTQSWFPYYLAARNAPRTLQRLIVK